MSVGSRMFGVDVSLGISPLTGVRGVSELRSLNHLGRPQGCRRRQVFGINYK